MAAERETPGNENRARHNLTRDSLSAAAEPWTPGNEGRRRTSSLERKTPRCGHWVPPDEAKTAVGPTWFTPSPPSSSAAELISYRELCSKLIQRRIPSFQPQSDFDIIATGFSDIKGNAAEVRQWVDSFYQFLLLEEFDGNVQALEHLVATKLTARADVTGLKPSAGDDGVVIMPIPDTLYSLRIWPGSRFRGEYCADFVIAEGATTTPINTATGFEIWLIFPHYINWKPVRIISLDSSLSTTTLVAQGKETYVLKDGQECTVKLNGVDLLLFEVPKRPRLNPPTRCLSGICAVGVENAQFNALDLDSSLYYCVAPQL